MCVTPVWVKSHKKVTFLPTTGFLFISRNHQKICLFAHVVGISLKCVKIKWRTTFFQIVSSNFFSIEIKFDNNYCLFFVVVNPLLLFSKKWRQTKKTYSFRFHSLGSLFLADGNHAYTDSSNHLARFCASHTHVWQRVGGGVDEGSCGPAFCQARWPGNQPTHTLSEARIWRRGM